MEYDSTNRMHLVLYEDGDEDWYDLQGVNYRLTSDNRNHEANNANKYGRHKLVKTFSSIGMSGAALLGQRLEIFWVDEKDQGKGHGIQRRSKSIG